METGSRKWGRPYLTRKFYLADRREHGRRRAAGDGQAQRPLDRRAPSTSSAPTRCTAATGARSSTTRSCISRSATIRRSISRSSAGSRVVEAGAQGEHKLARGYLPQTTYSAHFIADPDLRRAIADYLKRERAYVAEAGRELTDAGPFRKSADDGLRLRAEADVS